MICTANQLTGFYMRATLALNGLNQKTKNLKDHKECLYVPVNQTTSIPVMITSKSFKSVQMKLVIWKSGVQFRFRNET